MISRNDFRVHTFDFYEKDDMMEEYHMHIRENNFRSVPYSILELFVCNILQEYIPELQEFDYYYENLSMVSNDRELHGMVLSTYPYIYFIIQIK